MDFQLESVNSFVTLNNRVNMPILGIGTWNLRGKSLINTVKTALDLGYRHFDTASYYNNEEELGKALHDFEERELLFITSKIWPNDFGFDNTVKAFNKSLKKLNLDYIDNYIIHWPSDQLRTHDTWKALVKLHEEGKIRTIGVSNFSISDIQGVIGASPHGLVPSNNQIKFHPYSYKSELLDYCKAEDIQVVAYSPLMEGRHLNHPALKSIASKYNRTTAQILLRWGLQHNCVVIPKTSNEKRLKENMNVFDFELRNEDMEELNNLSN